uniref:Prosaposin n=1 Tax=Leptobrachium leishanense TaxID=445787 RepID=A0A8C5WBV1_9ANUR
MKLLVALCCALLTVSASPLLGTEQCAQGSAVWCEDIKTASQCGAVKHCQQTVWNQPTVKTVSCDLCKEVLTVVGNFLKYNCSESEAQQFLDKVCDLVPEPTISSKCKELVASYFPLLYSLVLEELNNPGMVCQAMHLCQSLQQHLGSLKLTKPLQTNEIPELDSSETVYPFMANVPLLLFPQEKTQQKSMTGDVCQDCLKLVGDLQDTVRSNASYFTDFVNRVLKDCDNLGGGLSDMCKTYVNQYAEFVLQALLQMPAQQICSLFAMCSETKSPSEVLTPAKIVPAMKLQPAMKIEKEQPVQLNPTCELCELLVEELERLLAKNHTEEALEKALEKFCSILPEKYRPKCVDLVDTYSRIIIDMLVSGADPKTICTFCGICSNNPGAVIVKLDPVVVKSGGCCKICKLIVNYVDSVLEKNTTEERITDALIRVCNFLPNEMQDQCRSILSAYEPMLLQLLLQTLVPDYVCMELGLCSSSKIPLVGTDKCTLGPSYWCKDMSTAAMCNAVQHCKRHVWV